MLTRGKEREGQSAGYRRFTLRPSFSDTVCCDLRVHVAIAYCAAARPASVASSQETLVKYPWTFQDFQVFSFNIVNCIDMNGYFIFKDISYGQPSAAREMAGPRPRQRDVTAGG